MRAIEDQPSSYKHCVAKLLTLTRNVYTAERYVTTSAALAEAAAICSANRIS